MLILLSGPVGSGKTTLCQRLVREARERGIQVAGVLAPALVEGGEKTGIQAVDLGGGQVRLLARNDGDLGGVRIGPYTFDDQVLEWVALLCGRALASDALVFVDEIGRLELNQGAGLARLIPLLSRPRDGHTVVIVRSTLVDKLAPQVALAKPRTVFLDPQHRDVAWAEMNRLLF